MKENKNNIKLVDIENEIKKEDRKKKILKILTISGAATLGLGAVLVVAAWLSPEGPESTRTLDEIQDDLEKIDDELSDMDETED